MKTMKTLFRDKPTRNFSIMQEDVRVTIQPSGISDTKQYKNSINHKKFKLGMKRMLIKNKSQQYPFKSKNNVF